MIVRIKKYVAVVAHYFEHEDGSITKLEEEITLNGQRFSEAGVRKQIPRDCKLVSHGYVEQAYDIDADALHDFCMKNGEPVSKAENNE